MSKQRIPPFSPTPPFLEKIFNPSPILSNQRKSIPPLYKGGGRGSLNYVSLVVNPYFAPASCKSQN